MENSLKKDKGKKKPWRGAGEHDTDSVLTCIDVANSKKKEMEEEWELEGIGILKSSIMQSLQNKGDYVIIKAYVNEQKKRFADEVKNKEDYTH